MSEDFALDTNIVIAFLDEEPAVVRRFDRAEKLSVPTVVLGELYFGALNSARTKENLDRLQRLLTRVSVVQSDLGTALEYGLIRLELNRHGLPIPDNDAWIAAMARQHNLTLVTRDDHFGRVERLRTERW